MTTKRYRAAADFRVAIARVFGDELLTINRTLHGQAMLKAFQVAIYARVSTSDKGQNPENQLAQLRVWCERMGHTVACEYVEYESGGKGADQRPQYAQLFADAARREFDMVLVWALDRFSRNGMAMTVLDLQRLSLYGVRFHSFTEPHLSTDNELVRDVLLALLSSLAKLERTKISERTKAGLERARALGKHIGRLPFSAADRNKLIAALDTGKSWRAVSAETGIPFSTVQKHARLLGYSPPGRRRETRHGGLPSG